MGAADSSIERGESGGRRLRWLAHLFEDPERSRRALDALDADDQTRREIETVLDGSAPSGRPLLFTGGALRGGAWERLADALVGPELTPGDRLSRYVLLEEVGAGGMGTVWAAWDPELDRKVAVKVLFPLGRTGRGSTRERQLAEARALAALSDPHVVAVYDAGETDGRVFLAMEYVRGRTLGDWTAQERPGWRAVVGAFAAAGRGLAAAHDAGIVHGDFKPHNVLMGEDGRVRVADFGLAQEEQADEAGPHRLAGTPGYLAPERLEGLGASAKSDQFAFAVALWESLHGERPYQGSTFEEVAATFRRRPPLPRPTSRVPRRVAAVVQRALSLHPEGRWPSMPTMVEALERAAEPRVRAALPLLAVAVLASLGAVLVVRTTGEPSPCEGLELPLDEVWGPTQRQGLGDRLQSAGLGEGAPSREPTFAALDDWRATWLDERTRACQATRASGAEGGTVAALREVCFDRRLRELGALLEVLSKAPAENLLDAPKAVLALDSPALCSDTELLAAPQRADGPGVAALEESLAYAKALRGSGQLDQALARVDGALADAEALDAPALRSELQLLRADVLERRSEFDAARAAAFESWTTAERAAHEEVVIRSLSLLTFLDGNDRAAFADAHRWSSLGEARLGRLVGGAPHLEQQLASDTGSSLQAEGRLEEALAAHRRALELRRALFGADSVEVARTHNNLGSVFYSQGRMEPALAEFRLAAGAFERLLGPEHPDLSMALSNVGGALTDLRRPDEAREALDRALEIRRRRFGDDNVLTRIARLNLGFADLVDRPAVAEPIFEQGHEYLIGAGLGSHPLSAYALGGQARALLALGRPSAALGRFDEALELAAGGGLSVVDEAELRFGRARALWQTGERSAGRSSGLEVRDDLVSRGLESHPLFADVEAWLTENGA